MEQCFMVTSYSFPPWTNCPTDSSRSFTPLLTANFSLTPLHYIRCSQDSACSNSNVSIGVNLTTYDANLVVAQYIDNWPKIISGNG